MNSVYLLSYSIVCPLKIHFRKGHEISCLDYYIQRNINNGIRKLPESVSQSESFWDLMHTFIFRALFTTSLHGKNKSNVILPGVSSDMMQTLLSYIYLRKLNVTEDNVYQLLMTADYLSILGVLEICCQFLEYKLNALNCIGVLLFAKSHFCKKLAETTWRYIMRYFVQVN